MSNLLIRGGHEEDFGEPGRLVDCLPTYDDFFAGIQDERSRLEEIARIGRIRRAYGMTDGQTMQKVACIPHPVLAALLLINPSFGKDKKEFYRWLERNPWYRVGRTLVS